MIFEIIFSPEALDDFKRLEGGLRMKIKKGIESYLRLEPSKTSKSRIKRLKGLRQPQYRLRLGQIRVFYDMNTAEKRVEIIRILPKFKTYSYLEKEALRDENPTTD